VVAALEIERNYKMENAISVIICCYNSSRLLPETLRFMANQQVSHSRAWEVIIVDNNSKDDTGEVALAEWKKYGLSVPFSVVKESKPGLSHAREAGIKHANHDLLLFCDDDNWLAPNYLERACQLMQQKPEVGILGGLNTPISSIELPQWLVDFETAYACGPQAARNGVVSDERLYITGAGMVIKKEIFDILHKLGFKSQLTDRKGDELSSGGDTEMCFVAAMLGYKLYYDSSLKLQHFLEPRRLTWAYFIKLMRGHIQSYYKLMFYKKMYANESVSSSWKKEFWAKSKNFFDRNGLITLYHHFYKDNQAIGNADSIARLWEVELWKAHFRMRNHYSDFVNSVFNVSELMKKINKNNVKEINN
jgi:glycosyltransferase involved in cell wall biosynthesis